MKVIVFAPHPDDETLGCGGTILKHVERGDQVYWVIFSVMSSEQGYSSGTIERREAEIEKVTKEYGFKKVFKGNFLTANLDKYSMSSLVEFVSDVVKEVEPDNIYLPFPGDIHSDHGVVYDACKSCVKSFRYPSISSVRVYETLSETDFALDTNSKSFSPNLFISINDFLDKKIEIMGLYQSELGEHPFPRSERAIRAQATLRGTVAGVESAEAFMLMREIEI